MLIPKIYQREGIDAAVYAKAVKKMIITLFLEEFY
jgi:hypothetical protein